MYLFIASCIFQQRRVLNHEAIAAGCGKSTLLEILAGRAKEDSNSHLQGVVKYNNKYASEVHLSRLIAYISGQLNKYSLSLLGTYQLVKF